MLIPKNRPKRRPTFQAAPAAAAAAAVCPTSFTSADRLTRRGEKPRKGLENLLETSCFFYWFQSQYVLQDLVLIWDQQRLLGICSTQGGSTQRFLLMCMSLMYC